MTAVPVLVDIWLARLSRDGSLGVPNGDNPCVETNCKDSCELSILSLDEREQRSRKRFSNDRNMFALAHILLRKTLSRYAPIAPADWHFVRGPYGKPELAEDQLASTRLRFSLSHSDDLAVCAITHGQAVGVDTEPLARDINPDELADMVLTEAEQQELAGTTGKARNRHFLRVWTLKEAYVKAIGLGLSFPLRDCSFTGEPPALQLAPQVADDPALWHCESFVTDEKSDFIAIAVQRQRGQQAIIRFHPACLERFPIR